jgi:hypothetical protein
VDVQFIPPNKKKEQVEGAFELVQYNCIGIVLQFLRKFRGYRSAKI